MSKRKIEVIYNSEIDKKELYNQAKQEIKEIYKSLKKSHLDKKIHELRLILCMSLIEYHNLHNNLYEPHYKTL